jgi:hypothetical protein
MTTDQPEFLDGTKGGLPITYIRNKIAKSEILESELYKPDMASFNSRVGYITNCSTTMYAMLPLYHKESREYQEIINRLKICRKEQGNEIDKAKGLSVKEFPKHWTRYNKKNKNFSDEDVYFYNGILINKRPYFMRWLYSDYSKKYHAHQERYDNFSVSKFGRYLLEILSNPTSGCEIGMVDKYNYYSPLLDTDCLVNRICHYMENKVKESKDNINKIASEENILYLKDSSIIFDNEKYKKLDKIYRKYKSNKRNFRNIRDEKGDEKYRSLEQYCKDVKLESIKNVSSNISELANLAVALCYEQHKTDDKSFVWSVFGEGVIDNLIKNKGEKLFVPFLDDKGNILYLDDRYKLFEIDFSNELNEDIYVDF